MKKSLALVTMLLITLTAGCGGGGGNGTTGGGATVGAPASVSTSGTTLDLDRLWAGAWVSQGPGVEQWGQVTIPAQANPAVGAVRALVPHPTNPDVLYAGSVNGGVWRTANATASTGPTWVPLTDQASSMSVGDLQMDPVDTTWQTLVVGFGRFSAFRRTQADASGLLRGMGGPLDGLLRTTDGGTTWQPVGASALQGCNIASLVVRGPLMLVGANAFGVSPGLFRSTDGGSHFSFLSGTVGSGIATGGVSAVVADDGHAGRFYAAVINVGVFRSDDAGATWSNVTGPALQPVFDSQTDNVRLSVHTSPGNDAVYVGVMRQGAAAGFYRSADAGATWTALGVPITVENGIPFGLITETDNGSDLVHFSMTADPHNPYLLYVGGDAQASGDGNLLADPVWPNSIGSVDYTGVLFRADASQPANLRWTPLTDNFARPAGGTATAPHADSRCIAFDANGMLLESDDAGVYRRTAPASTTGAWSSLIGIDSLAVTEVHSVAWDAVAHIAICGTQDVGVPEQATPGQPTWRGVLEDDGGKVAVDSSHADYSIRYCSSQFLGKFERRIVAPDNTVQRTETPTLLVDGSGGQSIFTYDKTLQFYNPLRLNSLEPARLLIGTSQLYESFDRGDHLQVVGSLGAPVGGSTYGSPLVYGGVRGGQPFPDLIYVGAGDAIYLRTTRGQPLRRLTGYPGGDVAALVTDPRDWARVVALDASHVYMSTDAGQTWTDITGNLPLASLQSVALLPASSGPSAIVVAGSSGICAALTDQPAVWRQVGAGLPRVVAMDLEYAVADDVLIVGTLGRGVWTLRGLLRATGASQ